jgi:hypothetical protein
MRWTRMKSLAHADVNPLADEAEPRWSAIIAILAAGGLYAALPEELILGPPWLFPLLLLTLLIPSIVTHHTDRHRLSRIFGFGVDGVLTAGLIASIVLLITALPARHGTPQQLLLSAASL